MGRECQTVHMACVLSHQNRSGRTTFVAKIGPTEQILAAKTDPLALPKVASYIPAQPSCSYK